MFKIFANAWKVVDLRKKILYTLLILFIYRVGCYVPIPGVNVTYIASKVSEYSALGFLNMFSGNALSNMTVFALGITPYINSSIIMQLLTIAIPALERMSKEGDDGRKKIAAITRYAAVGLGLIQAIGIILGLGADAVVSTDFFNYLTIILCLTAGTALIMWLGERINEKGVGNGISLLIFVSIVCKLPSSAITLINNAAANTGGVTMWTVIVVILVALVIVAAVTFIDMGERRVPVQYAKRVVGRKQYGGQSTYIPMKVNQSGVMPLIFAITFVQFPQMIAQFWPQSDFYLWWSQYMGTGSWIYWVIYALLILFFTYFYSQIAFNPIDVSKNMQQYGGFIPGIRPGKPTSDYLQKILSKITVFGAIFLAVIAVIPSLFSNLSGGAFNAFGATSLLIMVSVSLETTKAIESQMMMRHYKGFL